MGRMQCPSLAEPSVSADVSEFARAELEAFVALRRREDPVAWARIEQLQQVCRRESPSTTLGRERSTRQMDDLLFSRGQPSVKSS
jgi:hypothetical protein